MADLPGWQSARTLPSPYSGLWPTETGHKLLILERNQRPVSLSLTALVAQLPAANRHQQTLLTELLATISNSGRWTPCAKPVIPETAETCMAKLWTGPCTKATPTILLQEPTRIPGR